MVNLIVTSDESLSASAPQVLPHMPVIIAMPAIAGFGLLMNLVLFAEKDFTVFLVRNMYLLYERALSDSRF